MILLPAVAGMFYPADPDKLRAIITQMLGDAAAKANLPIPKAIIAPHAGYIYSGPIAASAYACLTKAQNTFKRVVLLAPAHQYPVYGLATTSANFYATPLGQIAIDQKEQAKILSLPQVTTIDEAFVTEHAIEVHLPFLQVILNNFKIIPLLVGQARTNEVSKVIMELWNDDTLIIVSSDLSHYLDYKSAKMLDKKTAATILALDYEAIAQEQACGIMAIRGLLCAAVQKNLHASLVDLRNSGDTTGPKDQVVGYGAFHFH